MEHSHVLKAPTRVTPATPDRGVGVKRNGEEGENTGSRGERRERGKEPDLKLSLSREKERQLETP
jgi:hypothetical protein